VVELRSIAARGERAVHRLAEWRTLRANRRRRRRWLADWHRRGVAFAEAWPTAEGDALRDDGNPLRAFFHARTEGRGIWKWEHYFDVYHRHFERFRGKDVHILEIGIYSGGSLDMWHDYFGPGCHVYGVDIEPACLSYQDDRTTIFIGDQQDRDLWRRFRSEVPHLDIVVDDGGHHPDQQAASLEELLPHLRPGGVYLVEDVHGVGNAFAAYVRGFVESLNTAQGVAHPDDPDRRIVSDTAAFQATIDGIHNYPYLVVIEKRSQPLREFVSPKRGTEWAPFLRDD
jgi:SAM-dependent methyltransferase